MSRAYATPSRTQIRPTTPRDPDGGVLCTGHKRKAAFFTAGPSSKNPGRSFYTCPLGRDDEKRCKFFKWADELDKPPTPAFPPEPVTPSRRAVKSPPVEEIDWKNVDTDALEREAIASTPGSSQARSQSQSPGQAMPTPFRTRLLDAVEQGLKRKREDDDSTPTPRKADQTPNPFVSRSTAVPPGSALNENLGDMMRNMEELSEHLNRQERLLIAADKAKEGFRKTIKRQDDRIKELEARVKELGGEI